ncbi:Usher syndrome type-1C protein-binding protein 1 isoform X2 [Octodon degus]|uniref:Usher syndrome type-1C protein-binding protein 1 isoform X2 n=1 Tax=Octodon degus TaxID=10160 RepID=A0A6P6DTU4_OCTDE|nr:Usher syndrome type-1C protein-binding protein 1 isoform X2 [Octodon degus]
MAWQGLPVSWPLPGQPWQPRTRWAADSDLEAQTVTTSAPRSKEGELDPVAESSEEGEVACGSSRPSPVPTPGSSEPPQLGPVVEASGQDPASRAGKETEEDRNRLRAPAPEDTHLLTEDACQNQEQAAPQDKAAVGLGRRNLGDPDVFQTLQHALASLEATAAAWHPQPLSSPGSGEAVGRADGTLGPWQEVTRMAEKNAWLRLALDTREDELAQLRAESDALRHEVRELQDALQRLQAASPRSPSHADVGSDVDSEADGESWTVRDPSLVQPLLQRLHCDPSAQPPSSLLQAWGPDSRVLEGQEEQLRGSMEKLKGFNRLLLVALQGAKGRCEGLSMQLSQREAEATALHLALQFSEDCEEAYSALLALWEASATAPKGDLQGAQDEAQRLLARAQAAGDRGALQPSPEGSSLVAATPQEVAAQLCGHVQRLWEHRALVKLPPEPDSTLVPRPTVAHAEALVQAILEAQPGPALPQLEKTQLQQALVATRETLGDLALQLQLARREKRGLELREAALRAQAPALLLLLGQLRWELEQLGARASGGGGDSSEGNSSEDEEACPQRPASGKDEGPECRVRDPEQLAQDLEASLSRCVLMLGGVCGVLQGREQTGRQWPRPMTPVSFPAPPSAQGLQEQLWSLRAQLEQVIQRGRTGRAQSAELSEDLCRAHSALLLGFWGAHRKQEEQRRKLEKQMTQMEAWQAEELARLEATARALGRPRPCALPPPLGETLL